MYIEYPIMTIINVILTDSFNRCFSITSVPTKIVVNIAMKIVTTIFPVIRISISLLYIVYPSTRHGLFSYNSCRNTLHVIHLVLHFPSTPYANHAPRNIILTTISTTIATYIPSETLLLYTGTRILLRS